MVWRQYLPKRMIGARFFMPMASGREVEARTAADGWCCVTVDGWPLGGGKVSGGRVKNHYPKALRLL